MKFLTLYTPAVAPDGPPDPEHMAKMGAYMEASFKSGLLVATGGLMSSAAGGLRGTLKDGRFDIQNGPCASTLQQASGWAILNVKSREHLEEVLKEFLEMAGDGQSDALEIFEGP